MKKYAQKITVLFFSTIVLTGLMVTHAQEKVQRDSIIVAAREIMAQQTYCALITIDSAGLPEVRTMNPFPPDSNMVVWIATNSRSRKIQEIKNNPNVCLYYADHKYATGYVAINGKAELVDDMNIKLKMKREYWNQAFPDFQYLVLIKIIPQTINVLNYKRGMVNDTLTWKTPSIKF